MVKYEFSFGYESPGELNYNTAHGTDDESSMSLFIEADSAENALAWGQEVAEAYIKWLFKDDSISWIARRYSFGLEGQTLEIPPGEVCIKYGEYPDFSQFPDSH